MVELSNKVYKLVVVIIILAGVLGGAKMIYNFQQLPQNYPQEISVSGQGKVYAKPDIALVSLGVKTEGIKVADIVKTNTEKMNKIIEDVKALGVDEKDIQTTLYSITPQYNWTERGGREFTGYAIEQNAQVKIRDFAKISDVLQKATVDGANTVGDLQFSIDNPEQVQAEARAKAIEQAKNKATTLVKQAGLKIVQLRNVSEGYQTYPYGKGAGSSVAMESFDSSVVPAPQIQSGQLEYNVTVTLTYRVK